MCRSTQCKDPHVHTPLVESTGEDMLNYAHTHSRESVGACFFPDVANSRSDSCLNRIIIIMPRVQTFPPTTSERASERSPVHLLVHPSDETIRSLFQIPISPQAATARPTHIRKGARTVEEPTNRCQFLNLHHASFSFAPSPALPKGGSPRGDYFLRGFFNTSPCNIRGRCD